MANNTSDDGWSGLPIHCIYVVQGAVIGGSNLCIVAAILRYEALRTTTEYLIILGLSLSDSLYQIGFTFAGLYRILLLLTGHHGAKFTAFECLILPHNLLWCWTITLCSLMLSAVSLDRLLLTVWPYHYLSWSINYAKLVLGVAYGYSLAGGVLVLCLAWLKQDVEPSLPAICVTEDAISAQIVGAALPIYVSWSPIVFAVTSVMLYLILWLIYTKKKQIQIAASNQDEVKKQQMKRQRKMTKTLAISSACTFFVFCIPFSLAHILWRSGGNENVAFGLWIFSSFNALCNVFIYPMRHKEMQQAAIGLFTGKVMPANLALW